MSKYIGSRIVPKHCGTWSKTKEYEVLSLVLYSITGDSYISRKAVPIGVDIKDEEYWALSSEFSAQLKTVQDDVSELQETAETLAEQIAANVSASTDSDADYAAEVVDARVTADGEEKTSLGEAVRSVGKEVADARVGIGKAEYGTLGSAMESFSSPFVFRERVAITNNNVVLKGKGDFTTASYEDIKDGNGVIRAVKFTAEIVLDYNVSSIMTHTYIPISVFNEKFYGKSLIIQLYSPAEGYMNFSLGSSASGGDGDLDDTSGSSVNSSGGLRLDSISYNLYVHKGFNELALNLSEELEQVQVLMTLADENSWSSVTLSMIPFAWNSATYVPETGKAYDFYLAVCCEDEEAPVGDFFSSPVAARAFRAGFAENAEEADHAETSDTAALADKAITSEISPTAGVIPVGMDDTPYTTDTGLVATALDSIKVTVSFGNDCYLTTGQGFSLALGKVSDFLGKKLFIHRDEQDGYEFAYVAVNFGASYGNGSYISVNSLLTEFADGYYILDFDSAAAKAEAAGKSYDEDTGIWLMFYGNSSWDCSVLEDGETLTNVYQVFTEADDGFVYCRELVKKNEDIEEEIAALTETCDDLTERVGSLEEDPADCALNAGVRFIGMDSEPYCTNGGWVSLALSEDKTKVVVEFDNTVYQGSSGQGFSVNIGKVSEFSGKKIIIRREEEDGFAFRAVGVSFGKQYNTPYVTATSLLIDLGYNYYSLDFDTVVAKAEANDSIEFDDETSLWIMVFGTTLWDLTALENSETVTNEYQFFVEDGFVYDKYLREKCSELEEEVAALTETCSSLEELLDTYGAGNVLWGKKWFATGDSFTSGGSVEDDKYFTDGPYEGKLKTYPLFIGIRNNMEVTNDAISGSIMALSKEYLAYAEDPENNDEYAINYKNPFSYARYLAIPEDVDYITLWFGINDSGHTNLGTIDDTTNETFYGAWNVVMEWILTNRPWAHVGIIITNGSSASYREAEREIARKWGIPYLDMMGDDQVPVMTLGKESSQGLCTTAYNLRRSTFSVGKTASGDSHPCWQAHEYESTFIEAFLRRL